MGIGLTDLVIVDTPEALLVANRHDVGRLRGVAEAMTVASYPGVAEGGASFVSDGQPAVNEDGAVPALRISLALGETMFRAPHRDVSRHWIVVEGTVQITIGDQVITCGANQGFPVPPGESYTLANTETSALKLIEVQIEANVWA